MNMNFNRKALENQLVKHEGEKFYPYKCTSGKWTIGVGRNFEDRKFSVDEYRLLDLPSNDLPAVLTHLKKGISKEESRYLLQNDISIVVEDVSRNLPWVHELDDVRVRVILDMVFNMGIVKFLKFKKAIEHMRTHRWKDAAVEMLNSKWATQVDPILGDNRGRADTLAYMMTLGQNA